MLTTVDQAFAAFLDRHNNQLKGRRLEPTRRALEYLGDPQQLFKVIHVTGTNGKTSTSRMIESLLRQTGLSTGLFTSPHLRALNERIMINGEPLADDRFLQYWNEIQWVLEMVDAELEASGEPKLTFFEVGVVLAVAAFADSPVDVAVIEVGIGGEWDATNVLDGEVAVFTPIDIDHVNKLGSTLTEIARTKSKIAKADSIMVSAAQPPEALAELQAQSEALGSTLFLEGRDFSVANTTVAIGGQLVTVSGIVQEYAPNFLQLFGDHQAQNAAVAVAAVESFLGGGRHPLSEDTVTIGLGEARSPGRLEIISHEPTVLIDAAHNPAGAEALAVAVKDFFAFERIILVLSVLGDKDAAGILQALEPLAQEVIFTASSSERVQQPDELLRTAAPIFGEKPQSSEPDLATAINLARSKAAAEPNTLVLVTGSIIMIGETANLLAARSTSN